MKRLKIFPKLFSFSLCITLISLFVFATCIIFFLPNYYLKEKKIKLSHDTDQLIESLKNKSDDDIEMLLANFSKMYGYNINLKKNDIQYKLMGSFDSEDGKTEKLEENEVDDDQIDLSKSTLLETNFLKFTNYHKEFDDSSGNKYDLTTSATIQPIDESSQMILKILPISIFISFILASFLSFFFAKSITIPIKKIQKVARSMIKMDQDYDCEIDTNDELKDMAEDINILYLNLRKTIHYLESELKRTNRAEKEKMAFMRAASHELKTPIQAVHVMLDNMKHKIGKYKNYDVYIPKCQERIDEMGLMVNNLLTNEAYGFNKKNHTKEEANLHDLVEQILKPYKIIAQARNIPVKNSISSRTMIETELLVFENALSNIISNAIYYTDLNKVVEIGFNGSDLTIYNSCKPLIESDVEILFIPFRQSEYSIESNNLSTGLGLSIIQTILNELQLPFSFQKEKEGMVFTINLESIII